MNGYIYIVKLKGNVTKFGISTSIGTRIKSYGSSLENIFAIYRLRTFKEAKDIERILIAFYFAKGSVIQGREHVADSALSVNRMLVSFLEGTNTFYLETNMEDRTKPIIDIEKSAKCIRQKALAWTKSKPAFYSQIPKPRKKPIINIKEWAKGVTLNNQDYGNGTY